MKRALSLGIVSSVLCLSAAAQAQEAFTLEKPQVGIGLNYGIYTGDDMGDINPYGVGFGVHGGYTLPMGLYLGAQFEYYLGGSQDVFGAEVSGNIYQFQLEPGYDIAVGPTAVIRPVLGIGYSTFAFETCVDDECDDGNSQSKFGISPGAMALVDFGSVYGLAAARYNHIFVDDGNADGLLITLGAGMTF